MTSFIEDSIFELLKRDTSDADGEETKASEKEKFASWALFILIILLIIALFTSYILQTRRIQAVHETVISIFAGMFVGLILRVAGAESVLGFVSFDYQFFFNLLLPPIILASGYELHQGNFFRNIGTILTFAFAGTFISALVLGILLYLWALLPLEAMELSFVEAMSVGATLSATDPVTILAIFNTYKVDTKLYTIIFGESILNDAIAIVLFETAQRYQPVTNGAIEEREATGVLTIIDLFESFGIFLLVFMTSLAIGLLVGVGTSLLLKLTYIRRFPKLESCIVLLIAYASYFFATAVDMSGIVSLLFCGICMKHYAYHNMSRRTQLTTKFIFQVLAQLSENFIFIYLGLSLFTEKELAFRPMFILITVVGICIARWCAVFPLSSAINWFIRYRNQRQGAEVAEQIPWSHQAMLYWAGLRGAVGVALAAGLSGKNGVVLRATVLVVVVLTVIIFGGTTARMLEILGIQTGVEDDADSDDEFDIEVITNGAYSRKPGNGLGLSGRVGKDDIALPSTAASNGRGRGVNGGFSFSSAHSHGSPPSRPDSSMASRKYSARSGRDADMAAQSLIHPGDGGDEDGADLDLPPSARRVGGTDAGHDQEAGDASEQNVMTGGSIRHFLQGSRDEQANWFRQFDEDYLKPKLLLDPSDGGNHGPGNV